MTYSRFSLKIVIFFIIAVLFPLAALAQQDTRWQGRAMLSFWPTGLSGTIRPFPDSGDLSFDDDYLENVDPGFVASFLAYRGRFVTFGEVNYSTYEYNRALPPALEVNNDLSQKTATLAFGYRVINQPRLSFDAMLGSRFGRVELTSSAMLLGRELTRSYNEPFIDPLIALRAEMALSPRWSLWAHADKGGFGIDDVRTKQFIVGVHYQATDRLGIMSAYRALYVDYMRNYPHTDVKMAGQTVAVTWRF